MRLAPELDAEVALWGVQARFPSVVRSGAVSPGTKIGRGCWIGEYAIIGGGCTVGDFSFVGGLSVLGHDVDVGPFVHLSANVLVGGFVEIGRGSTLGLGAIVRDHVDVAEFSAVGMAAVVTKSISEPGQAWVGSPARKLEKRGGRDGEAGGRKGGGSSL
ncbi:trimeric LpxA-like protein [Hyaloraphidium curvatum]|nr:trimeric LpxA-like protein [Hyaloraphidium curvatum]